MRFLFSFVFASISLLPFASAGIMDIVAPKSDLQVVTYTEMTPDGAQLRPVTPQDPVYCIAINIGFHDFGAIIAGEKTPPDKDALKIISAVLRKQGYLPCSEEHPPTLLLVIGWGTLNASQNSSDPEFGQAITSTIEDRLRFLGAYRLNSNLVSENSHQDEFLRAQPGLKAMDAESETLRTIASDSLFVAAISAYDFQATKRQDKTKLWMTRIACPSKGFWLKDAFPSMIAIAGPNIGRETKKPVCVAASDRFKGEVKMGDSKVVEYLDNEKAPSADDKKNPESSK